MLPRQPKGAVPGPEHRMMGSIGLQPLYRATLVELYQQGIITLDVAMSKVKNLDEFKQL